MFKVKVEKRFCSIHFRIKYRTNLINCQILIETGQTVCSYTILNSVHICVSTFQQYTVKSAEKRDKTKYSCTCVTILGLVKYHSISNTIAIIYDNCRCSQKCIVDTRYLILSYIFLLFNIRFLQDFLMENFFLTESVLLFDCNKFKNETRKSIFWNRFFSVSDVTQTGFWSRFTSRFIGWLLFLSCLGKLFCLVNNTKCHIYK